MGSRLATYAEIVRPCANTMLSSAPSKRAKDRPPIVRHWLRPNGAQRLVIRRAAKKHAVSINGISSNSAQRIPILGTTKTTRKAPSTKPMPKTMAV